MFVSGCLVSGTFSSWLFVVDFRLFAFFEIVTAWCDFCRVLSDFFFSMIV